jgi:hypothetical protein
MRLIKIPTAILMSTTAIAALPVSSASAIIPPPNPCVRSLIQCLLHRELPAPDVAGRVDFGGTDQRGRR